jgi:hypothetical protein
VLDIEYYYVAGCEELDCDEEVPLLFLEDAQITYNGTEVTIM